MRISFGKLLVFVPDMELADDFYGGVFGLDRIDGGEDFRIFRGPDFELLLFECEEANSPEGYSQRAGSAVCFAVPDILESVEYLRQKDVQVLHAEP